MKIHEYQGKEVLAKYGVAVPRGHVAFSVDEAVSLLKNWEARFGSSKLRFMRVVVVKVAALKLPRALMKCANMPSRSWA